MKTTISLTLPRMGTLALSQMMNTTKCVSHHEVSQSMMDPRTLWEDTYEGAAEKAAHRFGMNYFMPIAYNDIALRKRIACEPTNAHLQVLIVLPSKDYWQEYITSCLNAFLNAGENHTRTSLSIYLKSRVDVMTNYAGSLEDDIEVVYVTKNSKQFQLHQLIEIAKYVGAVGYSPYDLMDKLALDNIEYLSECNISMSSNLLKKKIANAREITLSLSPNS